MRKLAAVLLSCLALTACGDKRFEGDVRFKVTKADSEGYELVLAQQQPVDMVSDWYSGRVLAREFAEPVAVGDEVVCHVVQERVNEKHISTRSQTTNCKKA
ncbi:hypothetical protein AB0G82_39215 [Streptomyces anulatus]|uniref:hypothetical protein n=1 Tax=Actinomycetes TaxID=1760 RepID=UPI00224AAF91|nr:hypothetical protein [Lentzea sp. NEAU-D7]MCX2948206.1 hypothetical protein [Lentzea sp. NEAU-D7]